MLFEKRIKNQIETEGKEPAERSVYEFLRYRKYVIYIGIGIIYILLALFLPSLLYHCRPIEDYQVSSDTKLVYDLDMTLSAQDRDGLTKAIAETQGKYFFLYYIEVDCKESDLLSKCSKTITRCFTNTVYSSGPMSMAIIHNSQDNRYFLYASNAMSIHTNTLDFFSLDSEDAQNLLLNTHNIGQRLFDGTPANVYHNVYQFIIQNSYEDSTGEQYAIQQQNSYRTRNLVVIYIAVFMTSLFIVSFYCIFAFEHIHYSEYDDWHEAENIVEDLANKLHDEKLRKKKLEREAQAKQLEEKKNRENTEKHDLSKHPARLVIENIKKITYHDTESSKTAQKFIQNLLVIDNIMETSISSESILFYLDNFNEGLQEIINYSKTHNTDFDTESEIEMINKALAIYLKISDSYISKHETKKANNIDVTLDMLQQKAALDGLLDSDFQI